MFQSFTPFQAHADQRRIEAERRSVDVPRRIPALDGFRALAILIVMLSHAGLGHVVPGGFGVTVFFFLSGYLITTLLRQEAGRTGRIDLKGFYLRRALRIFPPFYITAAVVCLLLQIGLIDQAMRPEGLMLDLLFLSNYADALGVSGVSPAPLWSLDVEEHFYLGFSVVFAALFVRMPAKRAAMLCAVACAVVLGVRVLNVMLLPDFSDNYYWSHTRMDSILFGCCLALWQNPVLDREAWRPGFWHLGAAFVVLAGCIVVRDPVFRETLRYTLQGMALFVVFSAVIQAKGVAPRVMDSRAARFVALLSYTLYLAHMPALLAFEKSGLPVPAVWAFAAAFGYAWVMHALIEKPLAGWRRRSHDRARVARGSAVMAR